MGDTSTAAHLDCRSCDGSGHGEQRSDDDFADCTSCDGTGVRMCDSPCCTAAAEDIEGCGDFCADCTELIEGRERIERRERRAEDWAAYGDHLRDQQRGEAP